MRKVLLFGIVGWNISETTRMIEIAKCAIADFDVYFISYGGQFNHLVTDAGFTLFELEPTETPEKVEYLWKIDRGEKYAHPFTVDELQARAANIPLINVIPFPFSRGNFNNHLPLVPQYPKWINEIFRWMVFYLPILTKNFSQVAVEYGLPKFKNIVSVWEGDHNLLTEIPSLYKDVHLEDNWKFIGPIYAKLDGDIPQEVLDFISNSKYPTAYFAMGSSANKDVLKQVLESLYDLPLTVIAPIKSHIEKMNTVVPSNILVTDWIPAHKVNPLCDIEIGRAHV